MTSASEVIIIKFNDEYFSQMLKDEWTWKIIQHQVEVACPWLPQLLRSELNTGTSIAASPTEAELMMCMLNKYERGRNCMIIWMQ